MLTKTVETQPQAMIGSTTLTSSKPSIKNCVFLYYRTSASDGNEPVWPVRPVWPVWPVWPVCLTRVGKRESKPDLDSRPADRM